MSTLLMAPCSLLDDKCMKSSAFSMKNFFFTLMTLSSHVDMVVGLEWFTRQNLLFIIKVEEVKVGVIIQRIIFIIIPGIVFWFLPQNLFCIDVTCSSFLY